VAEQLIRNQ